MGLEGQNAIFASATLISQQAARGVVTSEVTRSFRSLYRRWRSECPFLWAMAVRYSCALCQQVKKETLRIVQGVDGSLAVFGF
jgi:hypothetical protein